MTPRTLCWLPLTLLAAACSSAAVPSSELHRLEGGAPDRARDARVDTPVHAADVSRVDATLADTKVGDTRVSAEAKLAADAKLSAEAKLADAKLAVDAKSSVDAGPCAPVPHTTQGFVASHAVQRYRIVARSPDGRRLAVLYSHFGPSSLDPVVSLIGYEEGSTATLFHHNLAHLGAGPVETAMDTLQKQVLASGAADLALHQMTDFTPAQGLAWCEVAGKVHTAGLPAALASLQLKSSAAPCTSAPGSATKWQLCPLAGGACVIGVSGDCAQGTAGLVDLYLFGKVLWAIGELDFEPLPGLTFFLRSAGGRQYL